MEIRRILFPTDLSGGSANAVPYVTDLAGRYGAKLFVVHVLYDVARTTGWYVPHVNFDELVSEQITKALFFVYLG